MRFSRSNFLDVLLPGSKIGSLERQLRMLGYITQFHNLLLSSRCEKLKWFGISQNTAVQANVLPIVERGKFPMFSRVVEH